MTNQDLSPAELRRKRSNAVAIVMGLVGLSLAGATAFFDPPELPEDPEHAAFLKTNFGQHIQNAAANPHKQNIFIPAFLIQTGQILQNYMEENAQIEARRIEGDRSVTLAGAQYENDANMRKAQKIFMEGQGSALLVATKCEPSGDAGNQFDCTQQTVELGGTDHAATGQPACTKISENFTAVMNADGELESISATGPGHDHPAIYTPQAFDDNGEAPRDQKTYLQNAFGFVFPRTLDEQQTQAAIALNQFSQCRNEM